MSALFILLAQTKGMAIFVILLLLIVAGAIGYVTAWLYFKPIYGKKIKEFEVKLDESNNQLMNLKEENRNLNKKLDELSSEK